jgi:uncharacterized protein (UPF0212 family)
MNCPHCGHRLSDQEIAAMLGSLAKGKKKPVTKAESKRRAERLAEARKKRWAK